MHTIMKIETRDGTLTVHHNGDWSGDAIVQISPTPAERGVQTQLEVPASLLRMLALRIVASGAPGFVEALMEEMVRAAEFDATPKGTVIFTEEELALVGDCIAHMAAYHEECNGHERRMHNRPYETTFALPDGGEGILNHEDRAVWLRRLEGRVRSAR